MTTHSIIPSRIVPSLDLPRLIIVSLVSFAAGGVLLARQTPPDPIVRKPLLDATLPSDKLVHQAKMVSIDFKPLQQTGVHLHPIPVVGYIVKGTITFEVEGQPRRTLVAGDAFYEPANTRMLHFDNASDREPASFIACYLLGSNDRELITLLPEVPK